MTKNDNIIVYKKWNKLYLKSKLSQMAIKLNHLASGVKSTSI